MNLSTVTASTNVIDLRGMDDHLARLVLVADFASSSWEVAVAAALFAIAGGIIMASLVAYSQHIWRR